MTIRERAGSEDTSEALDRASGNPAQPAFRSDVPDQAAPPVPRNVFQKTFYSLQFPDYRWMWLGTILSFTAMQMQQVARGYLAYDLTGSAAALGIVTLAAGVPQVLLGPLGGVLVDRFPKRNVLYFTQAMNAVTSLVTAVLIATGVIEIWMLAVLAAVNGATFAFNLPARQSLIPLLVPRHMTANALALNNSGANLTRLLGPVLAGVLVAIPFIGTGGTFFIMTGIYMVVVSLLTQLHDPGNPLPRPAGENILNGMTVGLRHILGSRAMLVLMALAIVAIFFGQPYLTLMPVFAASYGVDSTGLGLLLTANGVGGLLGSLTVAYWADLKRKGLAQVLFGLASGVALIALGLAGGFWVALLVLVFAGWTGTAFMNFNGTLVMLNTPQRIFGRVMSIYLITFGLMPLAVLPLSALTDAFGPQVMAIFSGTMTILLIVLVMAVARQHWLNDSPATRAE